MLCMNLIFMCVEQRCDFFQKWDILVIFVYLSCEKVTIFNGRTELFLKFVSFLLGGGGRVVPHLFKFNILQIFFLNTHHRVCIGHTHSDRVQI